MVLGDNPNGWVMFKRQNPPRLLHAMHVGGLPDPASVYLHFFLCVCVCVTYSHGVVCKWECAPNNHLNLWKWRQTTGFGFQPHFKHSPPFSLSLPKTLRAFKERASHHEAETHRQELRAHMVGLWRDRRADWLGRGLIIFVAPVELAVWVYIQFSHTHTPTWWISLK